jgi:hypothetical protein
MAQALPTTWPSPPFPSHIDTFHLLGRVSNPRIGNDFTFSPKSSWVVPVHARYLKREVMFHDDFPGYEAERSNSKSKANRLVDCGNSKAVS